MTFEEVVAECGDIFEQFLDKFNKYKSVFELVKNDKGEYVIHCDLDVLKHFYNMENSANLNTTVEKAKAVSELLNQIKEAADKLADFGFVVKSEVSVDPKVWDNYFGL